MTQPILSAEEILAWNEKTAQGWRQLLTTHPELLTQPCDIAGTKTVAELLQHIIAAQMYFGSFAPRAQLLQVTIAEFVLLVPFVTNGLSVSDALWHRRRCGPRSLVCFCDVS